MDDVACFSGFPKLPKAFRGAGSPCRGGSDADAPGIDTDVGLEVVVSI